jgi:peptide/nickel transport system ATP-binding protein
VIPYVLEVEDLTVRYHTPVGAVHAAERVSFSLKYGEKLGLVGESGSGKSTTANAIMRMIKPPGQIEGGRVLLEGRDLLVVSDGEMRSVRFDEVSLIPQGAMNSLNPVLRIETQIADIIEAHRGNFSPVERRKRVPELLQQVGLIPQVARMFPHELSGGMKQRVCIAMAITLRPKVIIADEPTSALDVVVQRRVMETLNRVREELGASVILVGHDMGLMAQFVDSMGVMYAGRLVELGPVREVFHDPLHPYTRLLISSLPSLQVKRRFSSIPGLPPSLLEPPSGCAFHLRCPEAKGECVDRVPGLVEVRPGRWISCPQMRSGYDPTS